MVAIDCRVQWAGTDGSANPVSIKLPFSAGTATGTATANVGSVFYQGTQLFSGAAILTHVSAGQDNFGFYRGDGGNFTQVPRSSVNGTYDFLVSFVYFVA